MPIGFLNPGLLAGLAAAAIPLVLHLLERREPKRVVFPDLTLLQTVKARESRAVGVRQWLLLLLRMSAIALLVLGAARPRIGGVAAGDGDRVSLIAVIDASATMQTRDADGRTRFERAVGEAADLAAGLPEGSEVQWLLAGGGAEAVFGDWLPAATAAARHAGGLEAGDGACDLAGALTLAREAAARASHPLNLVFFTDLRAPATDDPGLEEAARRLTAAGLKSFTVRALDDDGRGGAVLDVALPVNAVLSGREVVIEAEVRTGVVDQAVRLELDGTTVAEGVCRTDAGGTARVSFALRAPEAGRHEGCVLIDGDRLAVDDRRPFVLEVRDRIRVLLSHGAGRGGWRYVAHALQPGYDAGVEPAGAVSLLPVAADGWRGGDLAGYDVLVLVDPDPLGRERAQAMRDWIGSGGALWLIVGDPARGADLRENLLPGLIDVDTLVYRARSEAGVERLRLAGRGHPALSGLPEAALNTLEEASWRRNWSLRAPEADVLAALEGGDPVLLTRRLGAGRVVLTASGLDASACDLAANPMFPPLAQRLTGWLAGAGADVAHQAGRPLRIPVPGAGAEDLSGSLGLRFRPTADEGGVVDHPAAVVWRGGRPLAEGPDRPRAGHWTLTADGELLTRSATVVPRAEAAAPRVSVDRLAAALSDAGLPAAAGPTVSDAGALGRFLAGRDLSAWCFLAALCILLIEHRLARGAGGSRGLDSGGS